MNEKSKSHHESIVSPNSPGATVIDPLPSTPLVTVATGPYAEQLRAANLTVGEIRAQFRERLDIDSRAAAFLNGRMAPEQTVVRGGDTVCFMRRAGEICPDDPGLAQPD